MASFDIVLAPLLAAGSSYDEAAKVAGVSVRTVARKMASAEFRGEVARVRTAMIDAAAGKLTAAMANAVDTLTALLAPETPSSVRRSAAEAILSHPTRLQEHLDFEARLAAVEARLDAQEEHDARRVS